jgi:hypothetical protein
MYDRFAATGLARICKSKKAVLEFKEFYNELDARNFGSLESAMQKVINKYWQETQKIGYGPPYANRIIDAFFMARGKRWECEDLRRSANNFLQIQPVIASSIYREFAFKIQSSFKNHVSFA